MINLITKAVAKIFGSKSEKDLKVLLPFVPAINAQWELVKQISDDDLRARTAGLRIQISQSLSEIDTQISDLQNQTSQDSLTDLAIKESLFAKIDKLEIERNKQLELVLLEILPAAFAIVKETARRFKENGGLTVVAGPIDELAASRNLPVQIQANTAFWPNKWMAAGTEIIWDMLHYDVQLIGGVVLHKGTISEMSTGEGKTLVATLPTFLNALAGRGVHIVTVNDYLAKRDSQWMAPLFEFHGITVDCIDQHQPNSPARRNAYLADITYGTNNEYGFDYLRDNMATNVEDLVQRKLHYAIVDEVDSVLIDDARTPLIISGPVVDGDRHEYDIFKPRIARLVEAQKALTSQLLLEAKRKIAAGDEKEGGLALFRAYRGLPKNKPLIKFLSESGMKVILQKTENIYLADNSKAMPEADKVLYFVIDEKNNQIDLTEQGLDFITGEDQDKAFFIMPDLSMEINALEKNKSLDKAEIIRQKDKIIEDYTIKSGRIHTVQQLLKAYTLFEKEVEYVIMDSKIKIVDEQTGRIMEGRRYSDGLHQAIEAKENVKVEDATQTYATITLQNYFRMYHKLAGMTGTAETEAGEFWQIYKLDVITIPTNQGIIRKDEQDKIYKTMREKYNAVVEEIGILTAKGQPVLVGTTSVENSELLSRMLKLRGISHKLLNAKYHQKEAEIVADAGQAGMVTIATNMAGRGTDIKLSPEAKAAGGLAIIGTERHESRRVDRQLRGRSGRQGDPGSSQFFVSLEDGLMRLFGSDRMSKLMDRMGMKEGEVIQHSMITSSIEGAQKKVEQNNFAMRKRLLEYDDVMNSQRELIYKRRRNALFGQRLEVDILNMFYNCCHDIVSTTKPAGQYDEFCYKAFHYFGISEPVTQPDFIALKSDQIIYKLYQAAESGYSAKKENMRTQILEMVKGIAHLPDVENAVINFPITDGQKLIQLDTPFTQIRESQGAASISYLETMSVISEIDNAWKEHLRDMDDLKQSVQQAVYEQKDPLVIYKFESFKLFSQFAAKLDLTLIEFLFKIHLASEEEIAPYRAAANQQRPAKAPAQPKALKTQTSRPDEQSYSNEQIDEQEFERERERLQPVRARILPNRNDRVSVLYMNGEVKRDVKFKTVEQDFLQNLCTLIEN